MIPERIIFVSRGITVLTNVCLSLTLEMFINISYLIAVDLHESYFVPLAYINICNPVCKYRIREKCTLDM